MKGCIETMHYKNGKIMLLYSHIKRLRKSIKYLSGERLDEHQFQIDLLTFIQIIEAPEAVIRVAYNPQSPQFAFSQRPIPTSLHTPKVGIAMEPIIPITDFSWIKKTDRTIYDNAANWAMEKGWDDVLLLNTNGMVAESTISNIFIQKNEKYYTPSLDQGCVAGIYRNQFLKTCKLKNKKIVEQPIGIEDLKNADEVLLCNAIRKLYPIELIIDENTPSQAGSDHLLTQIQLPFE